MGANIAAYIIDLASGENYIEFVQKHILDPLQMSESGWPSKNYQPSNVSTLYWNGYPTPVYKQITYGDAGFMTSITDFSKFLITMIQGYNGEDTILKGDENNYETFHRKSQYRAYKREEMTALFKRAGFSKIKWLMPFESGYYQPIILAYKL
jgi:CubicO group peptidase (beta-lactamase class C family)